MMSVIQTETQHPDHSDYGMFILVIMSHGAENGRIYGADLPDCVSLKDVYSLLSPIRFRRMAGKPKFIIVQACGGRKWIYLEILVCLSIYIKQS